MSTLSRVPFLGGYNEQQQLNEGQSSRTLGQLQQMLAIQAHQRRQQEAGEQKKRLSQFAGQLPPDQQMEFYMDPKGFLSGRRSEREVAAFQAAQPPAPPLEFLTGGEAFPGKIPDQPGMVGNVQALMQDISSRKNLKEEDRAAILAQIQAQQQAGRPQGMGMPLGMLSTNPIIRQATQFQETQQGKRDAAEQTRTFQETVLEAGRNARAEQRVKSPDQVAAESEAKLEGQRRLAEAKAKIPGTPEHRRVQDVEARKTKLAMAAKATKTYANSSADMLETSLADILGVTPKELPALLGGPNISAAEAKIAPAVGVLDARLPTILQSTQNIDSAIENLRSKAQMFGLTQLRQSGVAPGSITEKEWPKFESTLANLDQKLGHKAFAKQLQDIYKKVQTARSTGDLDYAELMRRVEGGEGTDRKSVV